MLTGGVANRCDRGQARGARPSRGNQRCNPNRWSLHRRATVHAPPASICPGSLSANLTANWTSSARAVDRISAPVRSSLPSASVRPAIAIFRFLPERAWHCCSIRIPSSKRMPYSSPPIHSVSRMRTPSLAKARPTFRTWSLGACLQGSARSQGRRRSLSCSSLLCWAAQSALSPVKRSLLVWSKRWSNDCRPWSSARPDAAPSGRRMGCSPWRNTPKSSRRPVTLKRAGVPLLAVLTDPTVGGVFTGLAIHADIIFAETGAHVGADAPVEFSGVPSPGSSTPTAEVALIPRPPRWRDLSPKRAAHPGNYPGALPSTWIAPYSVRNRTSRRGYAGERRCPGVGRGDVGPPPGPANIIGFPRSHLY